MMKKIKKYPKVVLVGRTNVGKSTIFNRLSKQVRSIVSEKEGITRDYLEETISWEEKAFNLIDTGGISLKKQKDQLLEKIRQKVLMQLEKAALILFVCDGKNGLTQDDMEIVKILRKTKRPILLVINKSDNKKALEENIPDFYRLGIKEMITISAAHGTGILDLLEKIIQIIPKHTLEKEIEKPTYKVVIIGKPNVGKSSLMNLLVKKERSIITQKEGTTREAISENLFFLEDIIQIVDTAGIRKKKSVKEQVEALMVKSSLYAIRESDIILLVIDSSKQKLSDQELKLLFYAFDNKKAIILVFNKTDLLAQEERQFLEYNLKEYKFILKKIPIVWISCKTKKNVSTVYREIGKIRTRISQKFDSTKVDELIKSYLLKKPMYHKTQMLKIKKIIAVPTKIPTFTLKVNYPQWFESTQLGFIENILRKNYDLIGCPIKFILKKG
ncbi:ribosome biogenesis GTPase Der [Candidatus Babeliales bacterium]|nr:ribosome biogenesis GTPase Der [Candidatus Babeliales bacterium]